MTSLLVVAPKKLRDVATDVVHGNRRARPGIPAQQHADVLDDFDGARIVVDDVAEHYARASRTSGGSWPRSSAPVSALRRIADNG